MFRTKKFKTCAIKTDNPMFFQHRFTCCDQMIAARTGEMCENEKYRRAVVTPEYPTKNVLISTIALLFILPVAMWEEWKICVT